MSNFNIGDKVVDINSGVEGRVTDRLYSEARSRFVYVIKPSDGGRSFTREDGEIEFAQNNVEYRVDTQIADNVVIGIIYEVRNGIETEVCRGHGHIIHDGAVGIAQACACATKRALYAIDNGIYFKQKRDDSQEGQAYGKDYSMR